MRVHATVVAGALVAALGLAGVAHADPATEKLASTRALESLPRKPLSDRIAVAIYQFRCGVPNVANQAAADMFTTALIKSGQFRVVERAQLAPGVVAEKTLNAGGKTTGDSANVKLTAAKYIFEGVVSEAAPTTNQSQNNLSLGGMNVTRGGSNGSITIDVRIIDAETSDVLDSVDVSQPIESTKSSVSGVGSLLGALGALKGVPSGLSPDVGTQSSHDDSVDRAVRIAIENAVIELVKRM